MTLVKEVARDTYLNFLRLEINNALGIYSRNIVVAKPFSIEFATFLIRNYKEKINSRDFSVIREGIQLFPVMEYSKEAQKNFVIKSIESYLIHDNIYIFDSDPKEYVHINFEKDSRTICIDDKQIDVSNEQSVYIEYTEESARVRVLNMVDFMAQMGDIYDHNNKLIRTRGGR
jgi:hypothetical protein